MLVPRQSCNRVRRQNSVSFRQGCVSQFGRVVPGTDPMAGVGVFSL
jgi:hypothetical protein